MAAKYELKTRMASVPLTQPTEPNTPVAEALTSQEFHRPCAWHRRDAKLSRSPVHRRKHLPRRLPGLSHRLFRRAGQARPFGDPVCFAFYLDKLHLIFIDEGDMCERVLHVVATSGVMKQMTTAHCLFEFMKQLTKDDLEYLADLEDHMDDEEEAMLDRCEDANSRRMLSFRPHAAAHRHVLPAACRHGVVHRGKREQNPSRTRKATCSRCSHGRPERLLKRSQTLKEYSLQLRELYQTRIDIRQNDTIQWFTVIHDLVRPAHAFDQLVRHELPEHAGTGLGRVLLRGHPGVLGHHRRHARLLPQEGVDLRPWHTGTRRMRGAMPMGEAGVRDEGHAAGMRGEADTLCSAASMQAFVVRPLQNGYHGQA